MNAKPLIERVLEDEGITSRLEEREATLMLEWLTKKVEEIAAGTNDATSADQRVHALCRSARRVARIVESFRDSGEAEARAKAQQYGLQWPEGTQNSESLLLEFLKLSAG